MSPAPTASFLHHLARQTTAAAGFDTAAAASASAASASSAASAAMSSLSAAAAASSGTTSYNTASSASDAMASLSRVIASASSAIASESAVAQGDTASNPAWFKYVGIGMAIASGFFIGSSFVLKKKGLLAAQKKYETTAGEGMQYLKSFMWWSGMIIMILGEVLNLAAYSFTDAILVTPMGALSVVVCAILSSIFLKEKLSLFGWLGCALCILGSTIIALNGPDQHASGQIKEFEKLFIAPGFLVWTGVCIATALALIFFVVPKYGKKNMLVHISICSVIGGLSVSVTSGLGSAILLSIRGQNQFKHWFIYFLFGFVIITLLTEIIYLNKALELFNTAMVTPTYYVLFTFMTLVTSIVLFQGLSAPVAGIITIVLGFLVICIGITILQLSKIDPEELTQKPGVDRQTTMLLRASRSHISHAEKGETTQIEEPGVDTVRGGLGIVGSVIRARSSRRFSRRFNSSADEYRSADELGGLRVDSSVERYRLHDVPVPKSPGDRGVRTMPPNMPYKRDTAISWASDADENKRPPASPGGASSSGDRSVGQMLPSLDLTSDSMAMERGDSSDGDIIQRRMYHTEPRGNLHGIREASSESPMSVSAMSSKYLDPYSAQRDGIRPIGPRLPSAESIRTMWDTRRDNALDTPGSDDDGASRKAPEYSTPLKAGDKSYPRAGKNASAEDEVLLSPRGNDSEEEEERQKTEKRNRFMFF